MASIRDLLNTGNMDDILLALRLARGQTGASQGQARGAEMDPNAVGTDQQYWSPDQGQTDFNPTQINSLLRPSAQQFNQGGARRAEQPIPEPTAYSDPRLAAIVNDPRNTITKEWDNPNIFDQPKPLPKNYIKNERTGVVTDLGPSQTQPQGERILDSQVQRDGSTLQMVEVPSYDGDGRQSMVKQIRRIIPDHLNPAAIAKVKHEGNAAETARKQAMATPEGEAAFEEAKAAVKERMEQKKRAAMTPDMRSAYDASKAGVKLRPGEIYDPQTGEISVRPGSALAMKNQAAIRAADEQKQVFDQTASEIVGAIDQLIGKADGSSGEHAGLRGAVGGFDSRMHDLWIGTDATNARGLIEGLKNKAAVEGLTRIRATGTAPGSITEREWPIFQSLGPILNANQGEEQFIAQLKEKRAAILARQAQVHNNYSAKVSDFAPRRQYTPEQIAAERARRGL